MLELNPEKMLELESFVVNAIYSRSEFFNRTNGGNQKRDLNKDCFYPEFISVEEYHRMYERNGVAKRVVEVIPDNSWKVAPSVYEDEDSESVTEFEESWDSLSSQLSSEPSYYKSEEGSAIWEVLKRADTQAGIGQYSVILCGFDDEKSLDQPVAVKKGMRLNYLKVFPQVSALITSLEADPKNIRLGQPKTYQLSLNNPRDLEGIAASGPMNTLSAVHWSRVVHISKNNQGNDWYGQPEMKSVFNWLLDINKIGGAGAEGYWKSCFNILSLETHPQLGGDVDTDKIELKAMVDRVFNGLDRALLTKGMSAKTLAPSVIDPSPFLNMFIQMICIAKGIPDSIFKGVQTGVKAGDKDESGWDDLMEHRFNFVIIPRIITPLINRLINVGVLPVPANGYKIKVNGLHAQSDAEKADIAAKKTAAIAQYTQSGSNVNMAPMDFYTRVMGYTEEEATEIVDAAVEHAAEQQQQDMDQQQSMIDQGLAPDPTGGVDPNAAPVANVFCATGDGGGVDPSCSSNQFSASQIMDKIKSSPQFAGKEVDWDKYAERNHVKGEFVRVEVHPEVLQSLLNSQWLSMVQAKKINEDSVSEKQKTKKYNDVVITSRPGGQMLIVDGNHSFVAAVRGKARKINVIIPANRLKDFGITSSNTTPVGNKKSGLTGGHWATTDSGSHLYIKGGSVVAGNPKVVKDLSTKSSPKPNDTKDTTPHHNDDKVLNQAIEDAHKESGCMDASRKESLHFQRMSGQLSKSEYDAGIKKFTTNHYFHTETGLCVNCGGKGGKPGPCKGWKHHLKAMSGKLPGAQFSDDGGRDDSIVSHTPKSITQQLFLAKAHEGTATTQSSVKEQHNMTLPTSAQPVTSPVKQPHEMTREEYHADSLKSFKRDYPGADDTDFDKNLNLDTHRDAVRAAAIAGKRIPDNVLDADPQLRKGILHDYPQSHIDYSPPELRNKTSEWQPIGISEMPSTPKVTSPSAAQSRRKAKEDIEKAAKENVRADKLSQQSLHLTPLAKHLGGEKDADNVLYRQHRSAVADALAAGKTVPPEVLADYPDLHKVKSLAGVDLSLAGDKMSGVGAQSAAPEPGVKTMGTTTELKGTDVQKAAAEKVRKQALGVIQGKIDQLNQIGSDRPEWAASRTAPLHEIVKHLNAVDSAAWWINNTHNANTFHTLTPALVSKMTAKAASPARSTLPSQPKMVHKPQATSTPTVKVVVPETYRNQVPSGFTIRSGEISGPISLKNNETGYIVEATGDKYEVRTRNGQRVSSHGTIEDALKASHGDV